jgi:hypothetical protein
MKKKEGRRKKANLTQYYVGWLEGRNPRLAKLLLGLVPRHQPTNILTACVNYLREKKDFSLLPSFFFPQTSNCLVKYKGKSNN